MYYLQSLSFLNLIYLDENLCRKLLYYTYMNILQKIIYSILELQEKRLRVRLDEHLKTSATNSTSKTVLSSNVTMTLNTQTEKNKELVKKNVEDIVKAANLDPEKLLAYIQSKGTKVCKIDNADKILALINEEEGLVCEQKGLGALYLNIMTNSGFSLKSKPMFVMRNGEIEPFYMVHQFYKWYSLINNLPGFDFNSQKLFKKYLYLKDSQGLENLKLDEMLGLQEAIARDQEATTYALELARQKQGGRKVLDKIKNDGQATI